MQMDYHNSAGMQVPQTAQHALTDHKPCFYYLNPKETPMVALTAAPTGGIINDTDRRDIITLGDGIDRVKLARDGKTDHVFNFEDGIDKINLSEFNVNWSELQVKYNGDGEFVITIRGEKLKITFKTPTDGSEITQDSLTEDDFYYATGAPDPIDNILLDSGGLTVLYGTDQPDIFVMFPDNHRDVVKNFDPTKDKIDLSGFGISFEDLVFNDVKDGKVVIKLGTEGLVVRDLSGTLTSGDFTDDMFVFV
jgi:hypothetical protein